MYINVNSAVLNSQTKNIDSYLKDYETGANNIKSTVSNISNIWRGSDYKQFESKMNEFNQKLVEFEKSLESFNQFIKGYTNAGSKLDDYYKNKKIDIS